MTDSSRYGSRNVLKVFIKDPRFRAIFLFRISFFLHKHGLKRVAKFLSNYVSVRYGLQLRPDLKIGEGFRIVHLGGIVIHGDCVIGKNFTILNNVTLGQRSRHNLEVPKIGDDVYIGTQTLVLGGCQIGNGTKIDAGMRICMDIKENKIVKNTNFK